MPTTLANDAAPQPNPAYLRHTTEFALALIKNGFTPDDIDDDGHIGRVYGELTAGGTGPREAAVMLRCLRAGLSVIDGGGESVLAPRPALRLVRGC